MNTCHTCGNLYDNGTIMACNINYEYGVIPLSHMAHTNKIKMRKHCHYLHMGLHCNQYKEASRENV